MRDFLERKLPAEFLLHRSYRSRSDSAGNNQLEVLEVGIHIQSEAMGGYATGDVDTEGSDLGFGRMARTGPDFDGGRSLFSCRPRFSPDTGEPGDALGGNPKVGAAADQNFFQSANVFDRPHRLGFPTIGVHSPQIEDGISHQLPGTVEGYVPAAITLPYLYVALRQQFGRGHDVRGFGVPPQSDDRRVLEQQYHISDAGLFPQLYQPLLQAQTGWIIDGPELDNRNQNLS